MSNQAGSPVTMSTKGVDFGARRDHALVGPVVPLSIAINFLLLFMTYGRQRQAGLVILNEPYALVGGIAALWLRDINLNLSAAVGFIALFGVAVLNGVVLVASVNRLREQGHELRPAILAGAAARLRPVLMTALVASFGFVPMAISQGSFVSACPFVRRRRMRS